MNYLTQAPNGQTFTKHTDAPIVSALLVREPTGNYGLWCWVEQIPGMICDTSLAVSRAIARAVACGYDPRQVVVSSTVPI